ncbi:pleckstrin domain-containing protein [Reticulomyxa filosa]|uniref:Pleckstrin domain-containing protein n=1 Tax=Reticulomyxa filosa TaxID=46433 RepID=X6PE50_RETFI|nr:pleckstrin domain-containing protein [Reticulomyxa filosa]|eukprot:ETO35947.1 pleckstrin domain-containing protein [Reticulomyxa filosa]
MTEEAKEELKLSKARLEKEQREEKKYSSDVEKKPKERSFRSFFSTARFRRRSERTEANNKKPHKDLGKKLYPSTQQEHKLVYEGWLKKRGPKKSQKFLQRWFELYDNGHLFYFNDRPSDGQSKPIGYIDMNQALVLQFEEGQSFNIKTPQRVWFFECLSDKQLVQWMLHLKNYMPELGGVTMRRNIQPGEPQFK